MSIFLSIFLPFYYNEIVLFERAGRVDLAESRRSVR